MTQYPPIELIDTHTGGEPTRVVVAGGPALGSGSLAERRDIFQRDFDHYRTAVLAEPRGSAVMVGALLCEPVDPICLTGVIFFNEIGYLGMCGHGTLGVVAALQHLGRLDAGSHRIETPVGVVQIEALDSGAAAFENVASYRHAERVVIALADGTTLHGDVAYGGNWFFLVPQEEHGQRIDDSRIPALTEYCLAIREALQRQGITGAAGGEIDHIELFGPPSSDECNSRNFVLCPGSEYDRSPCGTGTSAKLACLAAEEKLAEGETWVQESIIRSRFSGSYRMQQGALIPRIEGAAHVNGTVQILLNDNDPYCWGIR